MEEEQKEVPVQKRSKRFYRILRSALIIYVVLTVLVVVGEPWLMFPGIIRPSDKIDTSHPQLKTVFFESGDGQKLQGIMFLPEQPRGIVIICHGNGDLLCYMEEEIQIMSRRFGVAVFAFDYRGYGESEGFPSAKRLYEDGQAAYDFVVSQGYRPEEIVVYGRSLGGAIAVSIAAENKVAGLGLRSTFSSITEVAANKFFWLPVRWLLSNRFPSSKKIESYEGPLVQRHGTADRIVPIEFGRELHEAAINASSKVFVEEEGLGHNVPPTEAFWIAFGKMLDECLPKNPL